MIVGWLNTGVVTVHLLALSVWVGSMVTIAVFARVSSRVLDDRARIALFAGVGRAFATVGPVALIVAVVTALVTAGVPSGWGGHGWALAAVGVATAVVSVVAMLQAHRMTGLRRARAESPTDATVAAVVDRQARVADALRGLLGALTIALVIVEALAVVAHGT